MRHWQLGLKPLLEGDAAAAQSIWLAALAELDWVEVEAALAGLHAFLSAEAIAALNDHRLTDAERIAEQLIELDPQAASYCLLGRALAQQGDDAAAIACWQQAAALDAACIDAYQQQAVLLQKLEQFADAIACYRQVLQRQPHAAAALYHLGLCLWQTGQVADAIDGFTTTIEQDSDCAAAYGALGCCQLQQGDWVGAIAQFQRLLQRVPEFVQAYLSWQPRRPDDSAAANAALLRSIQAGSDAALRRRFAVLQAPPELTSIEPPDRAPLQGFYETAAAWATATASPFVRLDPPTLVALTPPHTLDRDIHFSFRFRSPIELPGSFVVAIPQGRFWLNADQTSSAVIAADDRLLGDLSPEFPILSPGHPDMHPRRHSLLRQPHLPPVQQMAGTVVVLSGLLNDLYFHWMLDVLPRIDLLRRSGWGWAEIDAVVVCDRLPFQQETLEQLGVPASKIVRRSEELHLQADQLIVPSFPGSVAWMPAWVCQFLQQHFRLPQRVDSGDRLYISRQFAAQRRVINETAVVSLLQEFGFQAVTLETLSVKAQAALFANARVVVAPHGSGLTNLVFCQPGTQVIELFAPNYVYPCYWLISNLVQLRYAYLLGELAIGAPFNQILHPDPRAEEILIDLDKLRDLLKAIA